MGTVVVYLPDGNAQRAHTTASQRWIAGRLASIKGYEFAGDPSVPITVGWGTRDRVFRPHQADRVRQRLPRARVVELPGCGHIPMSDDPELVASLILSTTGGQYR